MARKRSKGFGNAAGRIESLIDAARRAAGLAHAPYSGFAVGAALEDCDGSVGLGANIENAAYPAGICAERTALLLWRDAMLGPVRRVVIYTPTERPSPPCGLCREALRRWAPDADIYLACATRVKGPARPADWLPARTPVRKLPAADAG